MENCRFERANLSHPFVIALHSDIGDSKTFAGLKRLECIL